MKDRSPDQTVISISLPRELLARIDARATSLDMPRSRYLTLLARTDVERGGALRLAPRPAPGPEAAVDSEREVAEFLEMAVPALADYERQRDHPGDQAPGLAAPEAAAENAFWNDFLDERDEILKLKWIESQKAGQDIGYQRAIQMWLKHRPGWRAAHPPASV